MPKTKPKPSTDPVLDPIRFFEARHLAKVKADAAERKKKLNVQLEHDPEHRTRTTYIRNSHLVGVTFTLYPSDITKLNQLCGDVQRVKSALVRHLIRQCKGITELDLRAMRRDDQITKHITAAERLLVDADDAGFPAVGD